jgi:hypothetical protein
MSEPAGDTRSPSLRDRGRRPPGGAHVLLFQASLRLALREVGRQEDPTLVIDQAGRYIKLPRGVSVFATNPVSSRSSRCARASESCGRSLFRPAAELGGWQQTWSPGAGRPRVRGHSVRRSGPGPSSPQPTAGPPSPPGRPTPSSRCTEGATGRRTSARSRCPDSERRIGRDPLPTRGSAGRRRSSTCSTRSRRPPTRTLARTPRARHRTMPGPLSCEHRRPTRRHRCHSWAHTGRRHVGCLPQGTDRHALGARGAGLAIQRARAW